MKRVSPGVVLLLLAPILGELVSCHQSPLEFVNLLNFVILSLPYGFGALICRELVVRWRKGRLSLLLLVMPYAIYEEGIVVRSFFNPNWGELGELARYNYFAGVNWTWSELLVHFHTLISIGASVILTEILFPKRRNQSWVSNKALIGCFVGLLLWVPLGLLMTSYRPLLGWYVLSWIAILTLAWVAYRLPARPFSPAEHTRTVPPPLVFFLLGLVNMFTFFFTVFLTAKSGIPSLSVTVLFLLLLDVATLWLTLRWSNNGYSWDDRHRLALVAGLLGFFIYFCFDHDFEKWQGSSIVGLATIIMLWQLGRSVVHRIQSSRSESKPSVHGDAG